ncbi:MAG TPA: hypothetical protein ENJ82_12420 [Bacteroidetes bacterium]|nr:hypothetical protein [Bacteroidota bacterium]
MAESIACPCGSNSPFTRCCSPFLTREKVPATAEALMRSRYTAHVRVAIPYLVGTVAADRRMQHLPKDVEAFAAGVEWIRLEIMDTVQGRETDQVGVVEFRAWYRDRKGLQCMQERSRFQREGGEWRYIDGDHHEKNWRSKVGRNDPCPCGSGKKFKKCCG